MEVEDVVMAYTQAEVLLQLKFEYKLLARDEKEIAEFHTKVRMITLVWGLSNEVSVSICSKIFNS